MIKDMIFGTVRGLGLFFFGMRLMSEGSKKTIAEKKTLLVFSGVCDLCL
jgi:hypothetical protein